MTSEKTIRRGLDNPREGIREDVRLRFIEALERSEFKTLAEWAKAANVNYHSMHNYSAGKSLPNAAAIVKLAKAAGVTVEELYPTKED